MPVAEILRPLPKDLPQAQLYAFLSEGRLGLWDGGAWLASGTRAATPFRLGSEVFHVAAPDPHVEELRTPSSIQEAWLEGPSAGLWQGPRRVGEIVPVLNSTSSPEVKTAHQETTMVGITHSATHSRALLWNLADTIPADVGPPQGYMFTGEHTVLEFARGFDSSDVVSADLMGIRSFAGVWSTLYRLRLGDRVIPLTSSDGQRLSTFTLGLGVPVKDLPLSFQLNEQGLWEWSHTYVLSVGYISTVACTTFRLDPRSAEGTISTSTWEEH